MSTVREQRIDFKSTNIGTTLPKYLLRPVSFDRSSSSTVLKPMGTNDGAAFGRLREAIHLWSRI